MIRRVLTRLAIGYGPLIGLIAWVIDASGPDEAIKALKAFVGYFLVGTGYEPADWLKIENLMFIRVLLIFWGLAVPIWAFWPLRTNRPLNAEASPRPPPTPSSIDDITATPEYTLIKLAVGPGNLLTPERRLEETFATFHRLVDQANEGDKQAARLAAIVAEWVIDAAKKYWASSGPYFRIEKIVLKRLGQLSKPDPQAAQPWMDPDDLERGEWELNFNPTNPKGRKNITFLPTGRIGDGRNANESMWSYGNGFLTINRQDRSLQNRFAWDGARFVCTNDPNAKGIKDQRIVRIGYFMIPK